MIKRYFKYLLTLPYPVLSYTSFKDTIAWGKTAVYEAKRLAVKRRRANDKLFNQLTKKKLPLVFSDKKGRLTYQGKVTKGKTLSQLTQENLDYETANASMFSKDIINKF